MTGILHQQLMLMKLNPNPKPQPSFGNPIQTPTATFRAERFRLPNSRVKWCERASKNKAHPNRPLVWELEREKTLEIRHVRALLIC